MGPRINFYEKGQRAFKTLYGFTSYLTKSSIEQNLRELIEFRISQINGCAYCLDMHSKDLRAGGETEQRLYMISAWREAPMYTDRERAALAGPRLSQSSPTRTCRTKYMSRQGNNLRMRSWWTLPWLRWLSIATTG